MDDGREWVMDGRNILAPERLTAIQRMIEDVGPIIVEHWFYYGGCSPDRFVFDDFDKFMEYLDKSAKPGDAFHVWEFASLCRDDNTLTNGKYPDTQGRTPKNGAY